MINRFAVIHLHRTDVKLSCGDRFQALLSIFKKLHTQMDKVQI